jgi:hypothetical protein
VIASAFRWLRGRSWGEVAGGGAWLVGVGAAAGVIALALAVVAATPVVEAVWDRAVQWSMFPIVRGSGRQLFAVALIVAVASVAAELVLHGWLVERALELGSGSAIAVLLGAIAEVLLVPGDFATRLGAGLFGAGLGWMYVAGGRTIAGSAAARVAFSVGAVVLESLRLIG